MPDLPTRILKTASTNWKRRTKPSVTSSIQVLDIVSEEDEDEDEDDQDWTCPAGGRPLA